MAIVERRTPEETRGCILAVAWDLFRQLGTRTTVADVADKSGMSSANVYRFFPSKQALSEAVCEGLLGEIAEGGARRARSSWNRLRAHRDDDANPASPDARPDDRSGASA